MLNIVDLKICRENKTFANFINGMIQQKLIILIIIIQMDDNIYYQFNKNKMKKNSFAHQRVNKILDLSKDFQAHRSNIINIRKNNKFMELQNQRISKIEKLRAQKQRYFFNSHINKIKQLKKSNEKIVTRLQEINKRNISNLSKSNSHLSLGTMRQNQHNMSSKSLNQSFRKSQSKRILKQNQQMAERIIKSKSKFSGAQKLKKQFAQEQKYVQAISRYSQKNKKILTTIIKKGFKLKDKQVIFLPNIIKDKESYRDRFNINYTSRK